MKAACLALAAGLAIWPAAALAQAGTSFFPQWTIEPVAGFQSHAVPAGGLVLETRMLPAAMYVLDEDYLQDKGNIGAPAGTELVGLQTKGMGACAIYAPRLTGAASVIAWGTDRHFCLYDNDNDGKFDVYFHRQGIQGGFFNLFSTVPKQVRTGRGGRYHAADPRGFSRPLIWRLNFTKCDLAKKICRVASELAVPGFKGTSSGAFVLLYGREDRLALENGEAVWTILGAKIRVKARSNTSAEFALEANFPGTPGPLL